MEKLTITRPDDWHLHLRDGEALKAVLPHTVRQFARAIVMPKEVLAFCKSDYEKLRSFAIGGNLSQI